MAHPHKSLNSKAFLVIYLVVIVSVLMFWVSKTQYKQSDKRVIPDSLTTVLLSPVKPLPQFLSSQLKDKLVFTNASFIDRWSFVYFTNGFCAPACDHPLSVMSSLQNDFAAQSIQFVLINYDLNSASSDVLRELSLSERFASFKVVEAKPEILDQLIHAFGFLFLKTNVHDGYLLEQEHLIYLVDPKGRLYAVFHPPYNTQSIIQYFSAIRSFYARTE